MDGCVVGCCAEHGGTRDVLSRHGGEAGGRRARADRDEERAACDRAAAVPAAAEDPVAAGNDAHGLPAVLQPAVAAEEPALQRRQRHGRPLQQAQLGGLLHVRACVCACVHACMRVGVCVRVRRACLAWVSPSSSSLPSAAAAAFPPPLHHHHRLLHRRHHYHHYRLRVREVEGWHFFQAAGRARLY